MNIFEAFLELDKGKAIKRKNDYEVIFQIYSSFFNRKMMQCMPKQDFDNGNWQSSYSTTHQFCREDIEADDWEIYERPKE